MRPSDRDPAAESRVAETIMMGVLLLFMISVFGWMFLSFVVDMTEKMKPLHNALKGVGL